MLADIDFFRIRPLGNSRNKGFEELCVQLFRDTQAHANSFYRVDDANGDGGVEDIAIYENGNRVGMQAKLFDKLGSSQWAQINNSVKTAIKNHAPHLTEYHIYTSVNRPKDSKSWNNYCEKWTKLAVDSGCPEDIKFVWAGASELLERLTESQNRARLDYWFGCKNFTDSWVEDLFSVTEDLLGERYTPKSHVRTIQEDKLEAFLLTKSYRTKLKKKIRKAAEEFGEFNKHYYSELTEEMQQKINEAEESFRQSTNSKEVIPIPDLITSLTLIQNCLHDARRFWEDLRAEKEHAKHASETKRSYSTERPYSGQFRKLSELNDAVSDLSDFCHQFSLASSRALLVTGEAGIGKSHLLADTLKAAIGNNQCAFMLLGEIFSDGDNPMHKMLSYLGWEHGAEAFLGCMNSRAETSRLPSFIVIDAVNESVGNSLWKSNLLAFSAKFTAFPHIRLIISCRSDFNSLTLPAPLLKENLADWSVIEHAGFSLDIFKAVTRYFSDYNVRWSHFPPVLDEFNNPLFLKTFCEAFQNSTLPRGPVSLDQILNKRIDLCKQSILNKIDCPAYKTQEAVDYLAINVSSNHGSAIPLLEYRKHVDSIFDGGGESNSLYRHLLSNGLIVETVIYSPNSDEAKHGVRFAYERFSDYFIANKILSEFKHLDALRSSWGSSNHPEAWVAEYEDYSANRGLLKMLAILIPERFGIEFIELFPDRIIYTELYEDFLNSFVWRSIPEPSESLENLLADASERLGFHRYFSQRLKVACVPYHPLNILRLHRLLTSLPLVERELGWTMEVADWTSDDEYPCAINDFLDWIFSVPTDLLSDEQIWLAAVFLTWLLGSNFKLLRRRASVALIRILHGKSALSLRLLMEFSDCNDPYIVERVYAVACGVALRGAPTKHLSELAQFVYEKMFLPEYTPPHILQRDYAQLIMEYSEWRGALPDSIEIKRCRPSFRSQWPRIMPEKQVEVLDKLDGWKTICSSLAPENTGWYGDFGRYTMDAELHHFSSRTYQQSPTKERLKERHVNGRVGRRFILGRIKQLGWKPELFDSYDSRCYGGRMRVDLEKNKVERFGKKYQWIGLHELLGYVSDRYRMSPGWNNQPEDYEGAWQLYARDFDPTQPFNDPVSEVEPDSDDSQPNLSEPSPLDNWLNYNSPFSDKLLCDQRSEWVDKEPDDFAPIIQPSHLADTDNQWLNLSCHLTWKERPEIWHDEAIDGQLRGWTDIRCWLMKKDDLERFLRLTQDFKVHGNGCDLPQLWKQWLGEYPWASSIPGPNWERNYSENWFRDIRLPLVHASWESPDSESSVSSRIPSPELCEILGIHWSGHNYDFVDSYGKLVTTNPTKPITWSPYTLPLLVDRDAFESALNKNDLVAVWGSLSERSCYSSKASRSIVPKWSIDQRLYTLRGGTIHQLHRTRYDIPLCR